VTGRLVDDRDGIDSPNPLGKHNLGSGAANNVPLQDEDDFCGWRQSMAINQKLEKILTFKEAQLQVHRTVYSK
jgi:hypothetical protein